MPNSRGAAARLRALPEAARGILFAVAAAGLFSLVPIFVRLLADTMPAMQIVFWRMLGGTVLMGLYFLATGIRGLHTRRLGGHALRTGANFFGMVLWFWGIALLPLDQAVALHFTFPLFAVVLAALALRERVGAHRAVAAGIGFTGVLIILRPGMGEADPAALVVLGAALLYALSAILTKILGRGESAAAIVFYSSLLSALAAALLSGWDWAAPAWRDLPWILGLGLCGTVAPFLFTRALQLGDASLIVPLDFLRLPMVSALAALLFAETPDVWSWVGAAVIFVAATYIGRREARRGAASAARQEARDRAPESC